VTLPYAVPGNQIEYRKYSDDVSADDYFLFSRRPCASFDEFDATYRTIRTAASVSGGPFNTRCV